MLNKLDYRNGTVEQSLDAVRFAKEMDESLSFRKIRDCLSLKEILDAREVIITGCGDSWMAGIAMKPVFEQVAGVKVTPMRNIEFTRYYPAEKLSSNPNSPLVIGVSISGTVSRAIEAIQRAAHYGANTLAITNNTESPLAMSANRVLALDMPYIQGSPGILSYIASTMALLQIAIRIGRVRGNFNPAEEDAYRKAVLDHCLSYADVMEQVDDQMWRLAQTWKDFKAYDFVGDYADWATAFFGSAKIVECFGGLTTCDDSEDWCHINYFLRDPEQIGTLVIANSESGSFNRIQETVKAMKRIGRPVLVVTDADKSEFVDGVEVCTLPKAKYSWIKPLMQHLPMDIMAGYMMAFKGTQCYRAEDQERWGEPEGFNRIKNSHIEIL